MKRKDFFMPNSVVAILGVIMVCGAAMCTIHYPALRVMEIIMPSNEQTTPQPGNYILNPAPRLVFSQIKEIQSNTDKFSRRTNAGFISLLNLIAVSDSDVYFYEVAHYKKRIKGVANWFRFDDKPNEKHYEYYFPNPKIALSYGDLNRCRLNQLPALLDDFRKKNDDIELNNNALVLISLPDDAKYGTLIKILDMMRLSKVPYYAIRDLHPFESAAITKWKQCHG